MFSIAKGSSKPLSKPEILMQDGVVPEHSWAGVNSADSEAYDLSSIPAVWPACCKLLTLPVLQWTKLEFTGST